MQRAAMDQRTTMKRVAEVVLETFRLPGEPSSSKTAEPAFRRDVTRFRQGWLCSGASTFRPGAACV